MNLDLTVARSPIEVSGILDRLCAAPVSDVFEALGLPPLRVGRVGDRIVAYAGDAPNALEITYARVPISTMYEPSRTRISMNADFVEGRALASLLTVALTE
jgi:hypothetical protein